VRSLMLSGRALARCYTFIDVHAAQDRLDVARPGSLALALALPHAARLTRSHSRWWSTRRRARIGLRGGVSRRLP